MSESTGNGATASGAAKGASLELKKIVQEYPKPESEGGGVLRVIDGIDLKIDKPGITMLLGPSGCGKSTVLKMMGGVRPYNVASPTSGEVLIDGAPCDGPHNDAVMVFQRYANRPDLTVFDNVALPFRFGLWKKRHPDPKPMVDKMLAQVGLADKAGLMPSQLSGGQNQRVALARALVLKPRILLMDEPFGALDAQTREEMQRLLVDLYNAQPTLIVFVTHDVTEALLLADRVVVLSTQPAVIADEFEITEPRPRSALWLRSTEAQHLEERVLKRLHAVAHGKGQVRVSV